MVNYDIGLLILQNLFNLIINDVKINKKRNIILCNSIFVYLLLFKLFFFIKHIFKLIYHYFFEQKIVEHKNVINMIQLNVIENKYFYDIFLRIFFLTI